MAEYLIQEETLTEIADAVRSKFGLTEQIIKLISARDEFDVEIIPDGVTEIGYLAFANCTNLTSITLPESVTSIGDSAFAQCTKLTAIRISKNVETIGSDPFSGCSKLTTVTFEGTPLSINNNAFLNSNPKTINVPWSEGEVAGAPWHANNATINYGYVEEGGVT